MSDGDLGMVCDAYGLPHSAVALARHLTNNADHTIGVWRDTCEFLTARSADMEAQRDAASMRSGEWARRNWNASAAMKARIRALADELDVSGDGVEHLVQRHVARRLRALLDAAPAGGAE